MQPFSYTVEPLLRDSNGVSLRSQQLEAQRRDHPGCRRLRQRHPHPLGHVLSQSQGRRRRRTCDVGLAQVGIPVGTDLYNDGRSISNEAWQWQRSATEAGVYSDIPATEGGTSTSYTPSAGDLGRWLKATVTYDDSTARAGPRRRPRGCCRDRRCPTQALLTTYLTGYIYGSDVTHLYAQPFTTGAHTRGYLLKGLRLALFRAFNIGEIPTRRPGRGRCMPTTPASRRPSRFRLLSQSWTRTSMRKSTRSRNSPIPTVYISNPGTKYWIVISQTTPYE